MGYIDAEDRADAIVGHRGYLDAEDGGLGICLFFKSGRGVALLQKGQGAPHGQRDAGRRRGVAWRKACDKKGEAGLVAKPHPGRKPKLSLAQRKKLIRLMKKGPRANGYKTDLWTLPRLAEVIRKRFGGRSDAV